MFPSDADFKTKVTLESDSSPIAEDPPFNILILGDWSGRESRFVNALPTYFPVEIDRDNFDEVMIRLGAGLNLDFAGNGESILSLNFNELDDFHPDKIFQQVALFDNLRQIRRKLVNSDTFNEAAIEVRSWFDGGNINETIQNKTQQVSNESQETSTVNLLDQILGQTNEITSPKSAQAVDSSELSSFVRNIVKPHLIHIDMAEQSKLLMVVDEVISDLMRKILHHPQFQALESAWRGLYLIIKRIETDSTLKIYILDVTKNEIITDLKSKDNLTETQLYRAVNENSQRMNNQPWSIIGGVYTFSPHIDDTATLIRIAKIAHSNKLSFISHFSPEIFGFKSFGEVGNSDRWKIVEDTTENKLWVTLRSIPEAENIALTMPRVLIRIPYGEKTEPTETFYFEEFSGVPKHNQYLWTNPVFVILLQMAQTFREFGLNMSQNFIQDIHNLPLHFLQTDYGNHSKPCAEVLMTQSNCERIIEQGIIPLISFKDTDRVRIGRFQSIASPFAPLFGKWN